LYRLVFAGDDGQLYDHQSLGAAGRTGGLFVEFTGDDMVKMPAGASLVMIPGGSPVGLTRAGRFSLLEQNPWAKGRAWAVAALLPQGYTRTMLPAYQRKKKGEPLPLMGYTAVACRDGELYAAARLTDDPGRWDPAHYNTEDLPDLVKNKVDRHPENSILRRLAHCSLAYRCFTAQNIFYGRWEGGIPVSPSCNAECLGCISLQSSECCPSPQERIKSVPTPGEVAEVAVPHLETAEGAVVSFGQGCEGEPALASDTIVESIGMIRSATGRGTINMNSNGGFTRGVTDIYRAGLNAVRISLISAREKTYQAYFRPRGFGLADVRRSISAGVSLGVWVSLNLLVFPGLTDREEEVEALLDLVQDTGLNMVQLRNLNIDTDLLFRHIPESSGKILGVPALVEALKEVPGLAVGNFSRPVR